MHYVAVAESIRRAAAAADREARRQFVTYAVSQLTQLDEPEAVAAEEFTPAAAEAFRVACAEATTSDVATIDRQLAAIDAGTLCDGSMGPEAHWALCAIEARRAFLRSGDAEPVTSLAITLLDVIDDDIDGAELDDFLANPRMQAQYDVIHSHFAHAGHGHR